MKIDIRLSLLSLFSFITIYSSAQIDTTNLTYDTFFLAKKKGLLGNLGRSISVDPPNPAATKAGIIKNDLPFNKYKNYIIKNVHIIRLEFNQDINDTTRKKRNLGVRIADALHRTTEEKFIRSNLFFKTGDALHPYLLADNERHLRTLIFLQDAKIVVQSIANNEADVYVYTKDVFSIGAAGNVNGTNNFDVELKEENLLGKAAKLSVKALYDDSRGPKTGYGAEFIKRNVAGSFADLSIGFKNFNPAFNSGRAEESYAYLKLDRPLVSAYLPFTGNAELSWHKTANAYLDDSTYNKTYNYGFIDFDAWGGYNLGSKRSLKTNAQSRLRKFIALRLMHHQFQEVPGKYQNTYNYVYANTTGFLVGVNILKQNFYKTRFIYGFGRYEDVPEGFSLSLVGGWTNKQSIERPYYGIDFTRNFFSKKASYFNYTFRMGGYINDSRFDDLDILFNIDYFGRLKPIGGKWSLRNYTTLGITHQIRPTLNQPLYLNNVFGLEEFSNGDIAAQTRLTAKKETVFYNKWKLLGFRFAPFVFINGCYLVPTGNTFIRGDLFTSIGAGLRTRNEALIFGTIECRFNYFPRRNVGMPEYRIDFRTDLRYKYNSQYIKRPDFVSSNG